MGENLSITKTNVLYASRNSNKEKEEKKKKTEV